tara:strand:+ start:507 stop:797 length:291 start_codon:yes stop_codon:yes gene_type:complete
MTLTKEIEISKIEIVNTWNIQVKTETIVKENGVEISRSNSRHVLQPFISGKDGETWVHTATDISSEDASVQAIANAVWTDTVKNNYKVWAEAQEVI